MTTARERLIEEIQMNLGGGLVDLELEDKHYNYAVTAAMDRYRQRSNNAIEESFIFLDVQPNVQDYTLPDCVQEVLNVLRNNIGGAAGSSVDPFSLGFVNNLYLLQNPGNLGSTGTGMLASYDYAMQFQNLAGRMFGRDVMYTWDPTTKKIKFHRRFGSVEEIAIHVYNSRPEEILCQDVYAKPWLRDYATAMCKQMMGQARSLFSNLGGPQGGVTMNGEALITEAKDTMERLENELQQYVDSQIGAPFIIG